MWKWAAVSAITLTLIGQAVAQDVPGIEICTAEKTMERRTSCLQSNVNFLMRTIAKLTQDHQRQIDALKASVVSLQAKVNELQAAKAAPAPTPAKPKEPAAK